MLKIAFSPDRHFSPSKAEKVPKSRPKWSPKSAKMPPKRPPRRTRFLLHFWSRFLAKNEPQNGAQNGPGAPLFRHLFHMWSQISPLAPLLSTFGRFWCLQGSILASFGSLFGLISVPLFAPNASILGPYGARNLGASISATPLCFVFWSLFDPC